MRGALASFVLLGLSACAFSPAPEPAPLKPGEVASAQAANERLAIGKSTKADVRAALGEPVAVDFPTGYEVWVYRERVVQLPQKELVLLFTPSGILSKSRIR